MYMKSWLSKSQSVLLTVFMGLLLSLCLWVKSSSSSCMLLEFELLEFFSLSIPLVFLVDFWSASFFLTVLLISMSVFTFSKNYMATEVNFIRFHLILLSFVASMLLLIFSPGFLSLFLGWDGLGLTSFLLVIYYSNSKSLNAGIITFMTNRLGDGFLLVGASSALLVSGFNIFLVKSYVFDWIFVFVVLGAVTKSAQVPFSAWLPAAMAAPTPVSSLVHSSTLVTAGVYLIFRTIDLFSDMVLLFLLMTGVVTMLMASFSALSETDMKKIVALSTLSQLGLMVIGLGSGCPGLGFFHLITHAFFKALMFVSVGSIMHSAGSYQDLKVMGSSWGFPLVLGVLMGSNFSLCGMPFFSGFFSKEMIIQSSSVTGAGSLWLYGLLVLSILLTQLYSMRFLIKVVLICSAYMPGFNYSEEDKSVYSAFMVLILPACLTGSLLNMVLKPMYQYFMDPSSLKLFLVSLLALSVLISFNFNLMKTSPSYWAFSNLWLLPWFSGNFFSKVFPTSDYFHKVFCSGLAENSFMYVLKMMNSGVWSKNYLNSTTTLKFMSMLIFMWVLLVV